MNIQVEHTAKDIRAFKMLFYAYYFMTLGRIAKRHHTLKQYLKYYLLLFCLLVMFNFFKPQEAARHHAYEVKWAVAVLLCWTIAGSVKLLRLKVHKKFRQPHPLSVEILDSSLSLSDVSGTDIYPKRRVLVGRFWDYVFFRIDKRQLAFVKLTQLKTEREEFLRSVGL